MELDNEEETPPQWDVIVTSSTFMANLDPEDLDGYELDDEWLSKEELLERRANRDEERNRIMQQGVGCRKKKVDPAIAEATAAASDSRFKRSVSWSHLHALVEQFDVMWAMRLLIQ